MDYQHRILPFYMSYPAPYFMREEDSVWKDLEYFQQMYPAQAKQLQKRIAEILDKMDYEGSMSMMSILTNGSCTDSRKM